VSWHRKFTLIIFLLSLVLSAKGSTSVNPTQKFDEFGDLKCEDEYARLDNFALHLQQEPNAKGVIFFHGGKTFRGKLPRRDDAAARAARLKTYLVQRRGIPTNQVLVIDGGYAEEWRVEIWVVPPGASMPTPNPLIPIKQIKFRKGRVNPRAYRCGI
jgi:hypothetical protein